MTKLKFFDVKGKKSFETDEFTLKTSKRGTRFAITEAPSGAKATVFVKKGFKK